MKQDTRNYGKRTSPSIVQKFAEGGLVEQGNIDLHNRPKVKNPDGSYSTVRSMGIEDSGQHVLIPTVHPQGRIMSDDEAIDRYRQTGEHLGKFDSQTASDSYAQKLHEDQEREYGQ